MKPKRLRFDNVLDKIHRSIVWGCVGLTLYGFYIAGWRVHRYITVLKPAGEERERQKKLALLAEGQDKAAELQDKAVEFLPEPPKPENLKY